MLSEHLLFGESAGEETAAWVLRSVRVLILIHVVNGFLQKSARQDVDIT